MVISSGTWFHWGFQMAAADRKFEEAKADPPAASARKVKGMAANRAPNYTSEPLVSPLQKA